MALGCFSFSISCWTNNNKNNNNISVPITAMTETMMDTKKNNKMNFRKNHQDDDYDIDERSTSSSATSSTSTTSSSSSSIRGTSSSTITSFVTKIQQQPMDIACAINAFINIPMYTMALCFTLYCTCTMYILAQLSSTMMDITTTMTTASSSCSASSSVVALLIVVAYPTYILFLDNAPRSKQKPTLIRYMEKKCRSYWSIKFVQSYFPCTLHKTVELGSTITWKDKNGSSSSSSSLSKKKKKMDDDDDDMTSSSYIFLYHPHGVISMGANIALNTEGCDFERIFPGVSVLFMPVHAGLLNLRDCCFLLFGF